MARHVSAAASANSCQKHPGRAWTLKLRTLKCQVFPDRRTVPLQSDPWKEVFHCQRRPQYQKRRQRATLAGQGQDGPSLELRLKPSPRPSSLWVAWRIGGAGGADCMWPPSGTSGARKWEEATKAEQKRGLVEKCRPQPGHEDKHRCTLSLHYHCAAAAL